MYAQESGADARYVFHHALVQDAAYESLLLSHRRELHAAIAAAMERESDHDPGELAAHFSEGGCPAEAARYYLAAGLQALRAMALAEAEAQLELGLEEPLPETDEDRRVALELGVALGTTRMAYLGWTHESVLDALQPATRLAEALGDDAALARARWGIWVNRGCVADFSAARSQVSALHSLAEHTGSEEFSLVANTANTATSFWLADYASSAASRDAVMKCYSADTHAEIVA